MQEISDKKLKAGVLPSEEEPENRLTIAYGLLDYNYSSALPTVDYTGQRVPAHEWTTVNIPKFIYDNIIKILLSFQVVLKRSAIHPIRDRPIQTTLLIKRAGDYYLKYLYVAMLYHPLRKRIQLSLNEPALQVPELDYNHLRILSAHPLSKKLGTLGDVIRVFPFLRVFASSVLRRDVITRVRSFGIVFHQSFHKQLFTGFILMLNAMISVNYLPWAGNTETRRLFYACLAFLPINLVKRIGDRIPKMKKFTDASIYLEMAGMLTESILTSFGISKIKKMFGDLLKSLIFEILGMVENIPMKILIGLFSPGKKTAKNLSDYLSESKGDILVTVAFLIAVYKFSIVQRTFRFTWNNFVKYIMFYCFAVFGFRFVENGLEQFFAGNLKKWFAEDEDSGWQKEIRNRFGERGVAIWTVLKRFLQPAEELYNLYRVYNLVFLFWISAIVDMVRNLSLNAVFSALDYFIRKIQRYLRQADSREVARYGPLQGGGKDELLRKELEILRSENHRLKTRRGNGGTAQAIARLYEKDPTVDVFLLNFYKLLTNQQYSNIISFTYKATPHPILILIKDKLAVANKLKVTNPDSLIRTFYSYGFKMITNRHVKSLLHQSGLDRDSIDSLIKDQEFIISHPDLKNIHDILKFAKKNYLDSHEVANVLADFTSDESIDVDLNRRTSYLQNLNVNSEQSLKISFLIEALKNVVDRNQKNEIEEKQKTLFSYLQEIDLEENQRKNVLFHYMFRYLTRTISLDKLKYAAKIANKMYAQSSVLRRNIGSASSNTSVQRLPESVNRGRKQRNRYINAANQNA